MEKSVTELKRQIRNEIKKLKESLSFQEKLSKSQDIFAKIEKLDVFNTSETIMLYWSMPDEVQTHDFILKWFRKKRILLPVIRGNNLELKIFSGTGNMIAGEGLGIPEPIGSSFDKYDEIDLVILPGVAFDKNNNRLGRGKAYYDKLMPKIKAYKLGISFNFQLIDKVPVTPADVKMDIVVTG